MFVKKEEIKRVAFYSSLLLGCFLFYIMRIQLLTVFLCFLLSIGLSSCKTFLMTKIKLNNFFASLISVSLFGGVMFLMIFSVSVLIMDLIYAILHSDGSGYVKQILSSDYLRNINIKDLLDIVLSSEYFSSGISISQNIVKYLLLILKQTISFSVLVIVIPTLVFIFLINLESIENFIFNNFIKKRAKKIQTLYLHTLKNMKMVFLIQIYIAFLLTILFGLVMFVIGVQDALLYGLMIGLSSFLPYIGFFIVAMTICIKFILLGINPLSFLIAVIICQIIDSLFITTRVYSNRFSLNFSFIFVFVIMFLPVFGFIGGLFAVPFFGVLSPVIEHFKRDISKSIKS